MVYVAVACLNDVDVFVCAKFLEVAVVVVEEEEEEQEGVLMVKSMGDARW